MKKAVHKKSLKRSNQSIFNFLFLLIVILFIFLLSAGLLDKYFCFGNIKCGSGASFDVNDLYGISVDPNNRIGVTGEPKITELNELKINWVRMEFIENPVINYKAYIDELHKNNKRVLMIVDYRTINSTPKPSSKNTPVGSTAWTNYRRTFIDRLKPIATDYKDVVDAWEIWNEPDLFLVGNYDPGIPSQEYAKFLTESRDVLKNAGARGELIVGGLASGNQYYLSDTIRYMGANFGYDGIGVHPYGQRPNTFPTSWGFSYVSEFINKYYIAGGYRPLWITEIGTDDTLRQANYLGAFYSDIKANQLNKIKHVFWFCYSDSMVTPYGLFQSNGTKKEAYEAYRKVANNDVIYPASIYSPTENSSLSSNKVTFSWAYNAGNIEKYKLTVKNTTNNSIIYTVELPATQRSVTVANLPTDGSKLTTTLESYYRSNPYSVVQVFYAKKDTTPTPPPSNTQPPVPPSTTSNTSRLIINAQGISSNKPAIIKVITERLGVKSYHGLFEVTTLKDYTFDLNTKLIKDDKVYLYFCNDTTDDGTCSTKAGSSNRDLVFNYLKVDGVKVALNSPIVYSNGQLGAQSIIYYDRSNKEDSSLYDNGSIRDASSANGDFGTYFDGKAVFYGGERFSWGPVFNGYMPFNGAIVAKVNW